MWMSLLEDFTQHAESSELSLPGQVKGQNGTGNKTQASNNTQEHYKTHTIVHVCSI
jgi:hypothetical protein